MAIVLSVFIGLLIALPPVIFRFSDNYKGVDMLKHNTEAHYVAQVQEVYDGYSDLGNPFFADLKEEPYLFPPLSPNIIANFGKLFGISAIEAVMVARFIIITLLAFFIYLFSFSLTNKKYIGLVSAPLIILGSAFLNPSHILNILKPSAWSGAGSFIDYGRPINPQVSSLFFFAYLTFFWRFLQSREQTYYGIFATVILGLSFYVYLYTWTFIFALNGILFLIYLFNKEKEQAKKVFFVSLGASIMGLPYLLHVFGLRSHDWYAESSPRFGFVHTRQLNLSRVVLVTFVLFLLTRKWFEKNIRTFFTAFFIAGVVVVNEQVITGLYLFNHHYHWYYNTPLVIIFLVTFAFFLVGKINKDRFAKLVLGIILVALAFYNGFLSQYTGYKTALPTVVEEQRYAPFLEWVDQETKVATPFFTSHRMSEFLSAASHGDSYYTGSTVYTLAPNERLLDGYLAYKYLGAIPTSTFAIYAEANRNEISDYVFAYQYRFLPDVCLGCFPDSVIENAVEKYTKLTDDNFIEFLKRYPVEYLVWDKKDNPEWEIDNRFGLEKVIEFGDIVVYKL